MDDIWLPIMHSAMDTRSIANLMTVTNDALKDPEQQESEVPDVKSADQHVEWLTPHKNTSKKQTKENRAATEQDKFSTVFNLDFSPIVAPDSSFSLMKHNLKGREDYSPMCHGGSTNSHFKSTRGTIIPVMYSCTKHDTCTVSFYFCVCEVSSRVGRCR